MSAEAVIFPLLSALVAGRAYPDVAPADAALPRIVYQQVGGQAINYTEGTLSDQENARMQIACWATTRLAAIELMKQAEAALLAAPVIQVEVMGARQSDFEPDTGLYASRQDFSIWSAR
ncbi:DUF3168 domain-containing protein [Curvibacter sp. HBC28]|uniref:DUF3168 domain-containing protein n=1 Tax=Curvibacter microcysteis TaxID=3026419 RepID=A0ABT5MCH7_9BURK|nr:DUF3168 domain-containing protein [Curvibacter sp. HBC28]MDD0814283.1 DUF3168 domain-containing protein [Curvibacter sp. HBC28]